MVDRYIENILPSKPKSQKHQTMQLNWWKSQIGTYALADITPSLIAEYRDKLLNDEIRKGKKRSPSTVVRYMAALSHAYTIAMQEWGWIDDTPKRYAHLSEAHTHNVVASMNDKIFGG